MSTSDNEPLGESHPPQRPSAAARNCALSRVDLLLMESIAPPSGEERNPPLSNSSTAGGAGEASARGVARGESSSVPAGLAETGYGSVGGSCLGRGGVVSAAADRTAPTHPGAASGGEGGGGRGRGGGAEETGRNGSPQAAPDGSSRAGLAPVPLAARSLAANTTTASSALADSGGAPVSFRTRSGTHFSERAGGARMSRSISSRSRRAASMSSSIRPLLPSTRGLGLESLAPRTFSARASSGGSRLALPSSPSIAPGVASADTYRGRNVVPRGSPLSLQQRQQPQQPQQQHPLAGYPLRIPARHAGSAGRAEGGRPSVHHRLASGGREAWRAPAAAYNAAERRTGRDTTALRAVSARLDAAATAIDAVEIGVRSASDSLDSLLQLLESRPGSGVAPGATTSSRGSSNSSDSGGGSRGGDGGGGGGGGGRSSPAEEASPSMGGAVGGGLSGDVSASSRSAMADREAAAPFISSRGAEAGGGLRAANMLRRELTVGSTPPADHAQTEERVNADGQSRATAVSHSALRAATSSAIEDPVAARDALVGEASEELDRSARLGGRSAPVCATPRLAPTSSTGVEEEAGTGHHGAGASERIAVGSAPTTGGPGEDGGDHPQPRLSQSSESRRPSREAGSNTTSSAVAEAETRTSRGNHNSSLPLLELEVAMSGIDAERGRLILEIARLRGQQNQSLVQLQRLQHEQFIVRQRQVSTLSDIVNSFGRTVEAAGALPHGEDSSLGRISNDVVSTLRRMLRLLSATVPSDAGAAAPGERSASPTLAGLPPPTSATTAAAAAAAAAGDDDTSRSGGAASSTGTYSVGGRVALRPTGGDLTQEVIDAALQALPRLAAAATAISGARRVQGYLAGLGDGAPGAPEERRRCSKETIAALPDAPPCAAGVVGGAGDRGSVRGCVICLSEDITTEQPLCRLPCNHVFHRACVGKWLMMQDSCPTCRSQVPNVEIGPPAPAATTPTVV